MPQSWKWSAFFALILLTVHPAFAAPATMPATAPSTQAAVEAIDPSPEVLVLVNDPGNDSYSRREKAQKSLIEMSDGIQTQLRGALKLDLSDEARQRVLGILHKIDENKLLGPSVITMHYKNAPLSQVLEDFSRQCNADLGFHRPQIVEFIKGKKVSIDLDKANFWDALKKISSVSNLSPQVYKNESRMTLDMDAGNIQDLFNDHTVISGAFAIIPQQCSVNRNVAYARNGVGNQSEMSMQLLVLAEPKLRIISGGNPDWLRQCIDDRKNDLTVDKSQQLDYPSTSRQWNWQLQTSLREVADMGDKITSMKGNLKFKVQVKSESVVFDDILNIHNAKRTVGDSTITVKQVSVANGNVYQLDLDCATTSGRGWEQLQTMMELLDKNGDRMECIGSFVNDIGGQFAVTLTYSSESRQMLNGIHRGQAAGGAGVPQKLIWEVPTETKEISAPFEMKDLDLPRGPKK